MKFFNDLISKGKKLPSGAGDLYATIVLATAYNARTNNCTTLSIGAIEYAE
jgi:hypothetical protein